MYRLEHNREVSLFYGETAIMKNILLFAKTAEREFAVPLESAENGDGEISLQYAGENGQFIAKLIFRSERNNLSISIDAWFNPVYLMPQINCFDRDAGIILRFELEQCNGLLADYMESRWWRYVDFEKIPERTQSLLVRLGGLDVCLAPRCTEFFKAQLRECGHAVELYIGAECDGFTRMEGRILHITAGNNPYESAEESMRFAVKDPSFLTPLKKEKAYPDFLQGFGWCTWNAFYHDVSAEKIEKKLLEFERKGIMPKWILIDDGWNETHDWRICNLKVDRKKFPGGLRSFITGIKQRFGIEYVGVWHSFMGYWWGIEPDSKAFRETRDFLMQTNAGYLIPDFRDVQKAQGFYEYWHRYLSEEGVDFLKVDMQTETGLFVRYNHSVAKAATNGFTALEESVRKYFSSRMINCMCMGMEADGVRKYSSLIRSSDDFYPQNEGSFAKHLIQNVYNSIFYNALYYCDFDMWWTNQRASVQSAVLRAISGGPIYISDALDDTDERALHPLIGSSGEIPRCDSAAMPVPSQVYKPQSVIKIINTYQGTNLLALFNITESVQAAKVYPEDLRISLGDNSCLAYLYFEKRFAIFDRHSEIDLSLKPGECEIINFYWIEDGSIMLGDRDKYISSAFRPSKTNVANLLF